ncbi:MAG: hypothetical protein Q8O13_09875 [Candidatus Omnitrophota bacterium]|nr:hypothetical protein [Candidatus Omnitrophota bacterium]
MEEKDNKINKEPDWNKVNKNYKEWVSKIRMLPTVFFNIVAVVSLIVVVVICTQNFYGRWVYAAILSIIFIKCLDVVAERTGHKEGYFDGYKDGYDQGKDDVLGIDEDDRHFIDIESKIP